MTTEQKNQVREALQRYVAAYPTYMAAAYTLPGITRQQIAYALHNDWEHLGEKTWQSLARQVGFYQTNWCAADTGTYMLLRILCSDAQHYALAYGVAINTGLGKTYAAGRYVADNVNAFMVTCAENHNRKTFFTALLEALNQPVTGVVPELAKRFMAAITTLDQPLLIIDDAHKLKGRVLHFLVSIINCVTGQCGVVLMGNEELSTRIIGGARQNKDGFAMIYKTIGRKFITLGRPGPNDVEMICKANRVADTYTIETIREQCVDSLHGIEQLTIRTRRRAA